MINPKITFATTVLAVSMGLPALVQAELLENVWEEIDQVILNDQACGDATAFLLEGMVHRKVSTLRNGNYAVNINAMGNFTPLDGANAGEAAIFRQNINDVLPIWEDGGDVVQTITENIRVIGKGQAGNFRLHYTGHITYIGGEMKTFFEIDKVTCR